MTPLLSVAWRNISRSRARSTLTIAAILFSVSMTLVFGAFMNGLQNALLDDTIDGQTGAIQVHRRGYFRLKDSQPLKLDLEQSGALESRLLAVPGVKAVMPRIAFSGLVSNGSSATLYVGEGVDPARQRIVLPRMLKDVKGRPLADDRPHEGIVSAALASALAAQAGSSLTLQGTTQQRRENALDFDVAATQPLANMFENKRLITVPLSLAQQLLGMQGRATEYVVAVHDRAQIDTVASRLRAALGDEYEVHTWLELRPSEGEMLGILRAVLFFISIVFVALAVFGVVNTQLMSVAERTREIGTMLAVGMRRSQIGRLFMLEATLQAALAVTIGGAVAFALVTNVAARGGLHLKLLGADGLLAVVPELTGSLAALALTLCLLGAVFGATYPALRAARLRPVEALRSL